MTEVVRITMPRRGDLASVACYEARGYVSSLPRHLRHWAADAKVWRVDVSAIPKLTRDLRRAGFEVISDADVEQAPASWADAMYDALPDKLADQAYKALTRVLHPDTGGDGKQMAMLNAARDKARS